MRKHKPLEELTFTPKHRINIWTCSSGTGWRIIVGPQPFGKNGGSCGSLSSKHPQPWVDGHDVAGAVSGSIDLLQYAVSVLGRILCTGDVEAFTYALETKAVLQEAMGLSNKSERIWKVRDLFSGLGKQHVRNLRNAPSPVAV